MQYSLGCVSEIEYVARHFAKRAPSSRYSSSRFPSPSSPSVTVSPSASASGFAPLSTLIPGMTPFEASSSGNGVPSSERCRIVSSKRMTPLMNSSTPVVVKRRLRYARRFSSVDSTPIVSKRFLIVPSLSSAARIPFPSATSARAVSCSSVCGMEVSCLAVSRIHYGRATIAATGGRSSVGRALASQAKGRGFEPRRPLRSVARSDRLRVSAIRDELDDGPRPAKAESLAAARAGSHRLPARAVPAPERGHLACRVTDGHFRCRHRDHPDSREHELPGDHLLGRWWGRRRHWRAGQGPKGLVRLIDLHVREVAWDDNQRLRHPEIAFGADGYRALRVHRRGGAARRGDLPFHRRSGCLGGAVIEQVPGGCHDRGNRGALVGRRRERQHAHVECRQRLPGAAWCDLERPR